MRTRFLALFLLAFPVCSIGCAQRSARGVDSDKWIIAHRGASGSIAEHTLEAYAAAYFIGADMIEPDVVATRDGHIICLHDITLERVTNVEDMYPDRARADGRWYAIDFDHAELKLLRVDGPGRDWIGLQIPTLEEMLRMVRSLNELHGTRIGVVPEMKKPTFHKENGFDLTGATHREIVESGFDPELVVVQSFELWALTELKERHRCAYRLLANDASELTRADMMRIAKTADYLGLSKDRVNTDPAYVAMAHDCGLQILSYTFRTDNELAERVLSNRAVRGIFTNNPERVVDRD